MNAAHFLRRSFLTLLLSVFAAGVLAQAQPAKKAFEPQVGQEGKDVIWVPTPQALVDKMLDMAKVTANDYVIDLGSGDGRTVITAAKRGARALGIEYNPDMVELSKRNAEKEGVAGRASFVKADIFESDFSKATVITMYLLPQLNVKLRPKILNLKPGTRIVSHAFTMEEWTADQTDSIDNRTAYLWIVPARVEGTWQLAQGELLLAQNFQMLIGTLKTGGNTVMIANGRLRGDQLSFSAGGAEYTGRVNGNAIEGTVKGASSGSWSATRGGKPAAAPK
ncbi:MAG: class I SAM-dependent methyltransferase [Betaproteobacteria bacterium]|nr:class I SAM-dependent methyltransferase [Betaproteobacteria bacterium]